MKEELDFNEMRKELEDITEELKTKIDTFILSGLSQSPNGVYLSINGINSSVDRSIQNRIIFHKGEAVAKTCDICPHRVRCLFSEDLPCEEDEEEREKINALFYEKYDGVYEKEKVIEVLKSRGFSPFGVNSGNIQLTNVYEKGSMVVFI